MRYETVNDKNKAYTVVTSPLDRSRRPSTRLRCCNEEAANMQPLNPNSSQAAQRKKVTIGRSNRLNRTTIVLGRNAGVGSEACDDVTALHQKLVSTSHKSLSEGRMRHVTLLFTTCIVQRLVENVMLWCDIL